MSAPFVGPLARDDHLGLCSYSNKPGDPLCLAEAIWHGIFADEHGEVSGGLACCARHKPIMDHLVTWTHAHELPCGLPDARFCEDVNLCAVPWDEADEALMASGSIGATS